MLGSSRVHPLDRIWKRFIPRALQVRSSAQQEGHKLEHAAKPIGKCRILGSSRLCVMSGYRECRLAEVVRQHRNVRRKLLVIVP
jgi:hypothetical protein